MRKALFLLAAYMLVPILSQSAGPGALSLENDVLSVALSPDTAAISVTDKRTGFQWNQDVKAGFHIDLEGKNAPASGPTAITARVIGPEGEYDISLSLGGGESPNAINLSLSIPGKEYTFLPEYPFPFTNSGPGWQYVQNCTGEGALMPLSNPTAIESLYDWNGSQPWWGITDLKQAMMARLDTFRLMSVYAMPMKIQYSFYRDDGYVGLAKAYRRYFLSQHPEMKTQEQKTAQRPGTAYLKDAVYIYFWDDDWKVTSQVIQEMKAAGIDRAIATFYISKFPNRVSPEVYAEIEKQGWLGGLYRMATANLFEACSIQRWNLKVLTGEISEEQVLNTPARDGAAPQWERISGKKSAERWSAKARELIDTYKIKLFYFDTLVVQMAPCLDPELRETVEENMEGRKAILGETRDLGMLVGSGEGLAPTWALPYLDLFEGAMSLRTYSNITSSIPGGGYNSDFQNLHPEETARGVDETMRIPLLALGFHDYVTETWVWRDTTFQDQSLAWKKDLFNILYGAMPIWHVTRDLWDNHKAEFLESYEKTHAVREKTGFAEMMDHGFLSPDRKVQYTDWSNGYRVIVNFGGEPFEGEEGNTVGPQSFKIVEPASGH